MTGGGGATTVRNPMCSRVPVVIRSIVAYPRLPRTLAHSLFDDKTGADVLLFAKDPVQTTETLLEKHDIKGNVSIMGISKLKNEYKEYEKKRQLALSYDLFLADDRYVKRLAPKRWSPVACRSLVSALAAT